MKNVKKIILITFVISITVLLINVLLSLPDNRILKGYYKMDDYEEPLPYRDYANYYKYYYTENENYAFQNSKEYKKVEHNDIEEIKSYFEKFRELMETSNRINNYDFETSNIDENDYFIISNKVDMNERLRQKKYDFFEVFFYDVNLHILYIIKVNK